MLRDRAFYRLKKKQELIEKLKVIHGITPTVDASVSV